MEIVSNTEFLCILLYFQKVNCRKNFKPEYLLLLRYRNQNMIECTGPKGKLGLRLRTLNLIHKLAFHNVNRLVRKTQIN